MTQVARLAGSYSSITTIWCVAAAGQRELARSATQYSTAWSAMAHLSLRVGSRRCLGARIGFGMRRLQ
eukprot:1651169-Pyramimonas_sp.AAC.1